MNELLNTDKATILMSKMSLLLKRIKGKSIGFHRTSCRLIKKRKKNRILQKNRNIKEKIKSPFYSFSAYGECIIFFCNLCYAFSFIHQPKIECFPSILPKNTL